MAYVKLDCGILDSTLWIERECREVFITALLMAKPHEFKQAIPQIEVRSTNPAGWEAPAGWYGFVEAAGPGIIRRAGLEQELGLIALERLGSPDPESRTPDHEGRRMIRVDGGYLILNFDRYREKDHTAADRARRYRDRKQSESHRDNVASRGDDSNGITGSVTNAVIVTQAVSSKQLSSKQINPVLEPVSQEVRVEAVAKKDSRRASPLPEDFEPSPQLREWAKQHGHADNLDAHLDYFRDYCAANRKLYVDHEAALRNCIKADWGGIRKAKPVNGEVQDRWWESESGTMSKAEHIGVQSRRGESMQDFRGRIREALSTKLGGGQ